MAERSAHDFATAFRINGFPDRWPKYDLQLLVWAAQRYESPYQWVKQVWKVPIRHDDPDELRKVRQHMVRASRSASGRATVTRSPYFPSGAVDLFAETLGVTTRSRRRVTHANPCSRLRELLRPPRRLTERPRSNEVDD